MQPQPIDSPDRPPVGPIAVTNGVLVLAGYGLSIRVERGQLEVRDGIGRHRREGRIHRATGKLRRLVVLGHTGAITLEAIRWLADVGTSYLQIDQDGRVLAAFGPPGVDQPALRRAQALAATNETGVAITRELLRRKIVGQRRTLVALAGAVEVPVRETIDGCLARLEGAVDGDALRRVEADAAVAYWSAWSALPVRFAAHDTERVPTHWRTFGNRSSAITGQPRAATNPANAMLNYLYALLESETTLAARIVGLDPGLGIFHVDTPHRHSLSADLMEPIRPVVDRYLAGLIACRTFGARDFFETRTGVCRVVAPLTHELADTIGHWECLVLPLAQEVATMLLGRASEPRAYRRPRKVAAPLAAEKRSPTTTAPRVRTPRPRCAVCGTVVRRRQDRTCSPACEKRARVAAGHAGGAKLQVMLTQLKAERRDPTATPEARANLAASTARRRAEQRAWDLEHPERPNPDLYRLEILPKVQQMSLKSIRKATGLSLAYCGRIRGGELVPHARWWEALQASADPRGGAA